MPTRAPIAFVGPQRGRPGRLALAGDPLGLILEQIGAFAGTGTLDGAVNPTCHNVAPPIRL